jgi:hypothetical protein
MKVVYAPVFAVIGINTRAEDCYTKRATTYIDGVEGYYMLLHVHAPRRSRDAEAKTCVCFHSSYLVWHWSVWQDVVVCQVVCRMILVH